MQLRPLIRRPCLRLQPRTPRHCARRLHSARPSADNRRTMGGPPVGISPHNYSSAVAKNKCLADRNKTRTSTKPN